MATYEFILTFALPRADVDPAACTDALFEAGCDDATVGIGKHGSIALDFSRDASSADEAIQSAIESVQTAIPDAELVEAKPDLVNLSDLAKIVGCSKQNMRKYAAGEIRTAQAPFPARVFTGSPDLWHLYEVATWLLRYTDLRPSREIIETSATAYAVNLETQRRRIEHTRELALAVGWLGVVARPSRCRR